MQPGDVYVSHTTNPAWTTAISPSLQSISTSPNPVETTVPHPRQLIHLPCQQWGPARKEPESVYSASAECPGAPQGTGGCAHTLTQVAKSIGDVTSLFPLGISYYHANWVGIVQALQTVRLSPEQPRVNPHHPNQSNFCKSHCLVLDPKGAPRAMREPAWGKGPVNQL